MHLALVKAIADLKHATKPKDVAAAIKEVLASVVGHGLGNVGTTKGVLVDLKAQLAHVHDPKLAAELRAAIAKVEHKVVGREFVAKQIDLANKELTSTDATKTKIDTLNGIQRVLRDRGDIHAANIIKAKVDEAKRAQVAAALATTAAVKAQDLTVTVNNSTQVSIRDIGLTTQRYNRYTTTVGT